MAIFSANGIANITMHVSLIALMIGIFYFTYVPVVEKQVVKREVGDVMDSIANDIHSLIPKEDLNALKPIIDQYIQAPNMRKQDAEAAAKNKALMFKAAKYLGILLAVSAVVVLGIWYFYGLDMTDLLITNGILLVVVGITYFTFVTFVIKNYRSTDPNFVKRAIVQTLLDFSK